MADTNLDRLGRGMSFPFSFSKDSGGVFKQEGVSISSDVELIKQSIRQILGTELGSRIMRRDFGANLMNLTFEPTDESFDAILRDSTVEAILKWERRVTIGSVRILRDPDYKNLIVIEIHFTITALKYSTNIVFTHEPRMT